MPSPIIFLIDSILSLFEFILFLTIITSLLLQFQILNANNRIVYKIDYALKTLTEPVLRPIRRRLPDLGGIDLSPIVVILLINFFQYSLEYYF